MPPLDKFLGPGLLTIACLLVSSSGAYPNLVPSQSPVASSKYATGNHSHLVVRREIMYYPETTFQTFGAGIDPPSSLGLTASSLKEMAVSIVRSRLDIAKSDIHFQSGFKEGLGTFLYVRQSHDGVPFANAVANVALHHGKIVTFGDSFVKTTPMNIASSTPSRDVRSVISRAERILGGKFNGHATLEYLTTGPSGPIRLTHVVQIQNVDKGTWFEAYMDAHSGKYIHATDFVARASYKVIPIWEKGLRNGQTTLVDPQDPFSSPLGWHNNGIITTTSTDGNNVIAFKKSVDFWTRRKEVVTTPESSAGLVFNYTYVDTSDPKINLNATRTNAFYVINTMHDIAYKYGFTEKSFNFQTNNFGKGGRGNDRIEVQVRNGGGWRFHTPPDGQSAICQLRVLKDRRRNMAMENGMIIHEFTHGMTRRMVGGGSARCFNTRESRGLGEGFSDAMAEWVQQKPIPPGSSLPDYVFGYRLPTGGSNPPAGLRAYPYSILATTNPLHYSMMNYITNVHTIGEIWANTLHNVYATLVEMHGFSENARTEPTIHNGNVIFMHLFVGALSLLPCNPTFLHARDAWIQADQNMYEGAHRCVLWDVFASRGLGFKAQMRHHGYHESLEVPFDCVVTEPLPAYSSLYPDPPAYSSPSLPDRRPPPPPNRGPTDLSA